MKLSSLSTRLQHLAVLLPLLWGTERAQADEGIPALLRFAEQYRAAQIPDTPAKTLVDSTAPKTVRPAKKSATLSDSPALRRALSERDAQLARQQATLRQRDKELTTLRQTLAEQTARHQQSITPGQSPVQASAIANPVDWTPLQKLARGVRQTVSGRLDAQRATILIAEARASAERERAAVQKAHDQIGALKGQINTLKHQLLAGDIKTTDEQRSLQMLTAQRQALKQQLDEKTAALEQALQKLIAANTQQDALMTELKTLKTDHINKRMALRARQEKENVALNAQLAIKEEQRTVLQKKMQDMQVLTEQKEATLSILRQEKTMLQQQQVALTEQASKAESDLTKQTQMLHQQQREMDLLRTRTKWLLKPETLSNTEGQQAYAAGGALGREILMMLNERKGWGVNNDQQTVLVGVVDAFTGKYQLTTDVLTQALADSEAAVKLARDKATADQQKKGASFVAGFKMQGGVAQSPAGFWYRVDYTGDTPLRDTDIVDLVVKETLTDGTVIQDMSLSGNVLSQSLDTYPPLFREAISHLKNHGSLTMVVPPALAYGEAGYPPKVPPNATMVYELRIDGIKRASEIEGTLSVAEQSQRTSE